MFGLFGLLAFAFPVFLIISLGYLMYNSDDFVVKNKVFVSYVLFAFGCGMCHLLFMSDSLGGKIGTYFNKCIEKKSGGGLVGAAITESLSGFVALPGAVIIEFTVMIVCLVIITEKSLVKSIRRRGSEIYRKAKESYYYDDDEDDLDLDLYIRETDPKSLRKGVTKRGVTRNTKIGNSLDPDIHEIDASLDTPEIFEGVPEKKASTKSDYKKKAKENKDEDVFAPADFSKVNSTMNGSKEEEPKVVKRNYDDININISGKPLPEKEELPVSPSESPEITEITAPVKKARHVSDDEDVLPKPEVEEPKKEKINTALESSKVNEEIKQEEDYKDYVLPPMSLLKNGKGSMDKASKNELLETAKKLEFVLEQFGVKAEVTDISQGPSVTRYELLPALGTKVNKITQLTDDIKMNMAATDIRIEAPIPGKNAVGIEIPNKSRDMVCLKQLLETEAYKKVNSKIAFPAGLDISGEVVIGDIAKMPHLLVAGTTGSGKSVFTNSIIMSVLYRAKPDEVKLLIVDPKVVEFGVYNGIPHLLLPVVTDPKKAAGALAWAVGEMQKRYKIFASINVKDLGSYNTKVTSEKILGEDEKPLKKMPQILIVIDELADLMMVASKEVEENICRLAQLARAAGIHLVIATQRPSVDVVTGLIKANISSRVALLVSSGVDSRTIIDMTGAEKLLGNGDMLFYPAGIPKPIRVQGAYVSEEEIIKTVTYLKNKNGETTYDDQVTSEMTKGTSSSSDGDDERDEYFEEAARFVIEKQKASTSMLQRVFRIGFNRAARIMDQLSDAGIVGPEEGTKPRKVIMTIEEFEERLK